MTFLRERAIKGMDQNRGCNPREAMTDTKWRYFCEEQRGTYQSPRWGFQDHSHDPVVSSTGAFRFPREIRKPKGQ